MLLSRSTGRRFAVTAAGAVALAFLYEATTLDSRYAARQLERRQENAPPAPGARLRFTATAYCRGTTTASGVNVRSGIAAADPALLPVGSVIQVDKLGERYNGIYTVMDTGPKVKGRHIDIYMWNCDEALVLGRKAAGVTVLRLGWSPTASSPSLVDRLFRQRELNRAVRVTSPGSSPSGSVQSAPVPAVPAVPAGPGGNLMQK